LVQEFEQEQESVEERWQWIKKMGRDGKEENKDKKKEDWIQGLVGQRLYDKKK